MNNHLEINQVLDRIQGIEGIIGSMVFMQNGHVLGFRITDQIQDSNVEEICSIVAGMIESIAELEIFPDEVHYNYRDHLLIMKPFEFGSILLISKGNINMPMLHIAIKITSKRLTTLIKSLENLSSSTCHDQNNKRSSNITVQHHSEVQSGFPDNPAMREDNQILGKDQKRVKDKKTLTEERKSDVPIAQESEKGASSEDGFILFN